LHGNSADDAELTLRLVTELLKLERRFNLRRHATPGSERLAKPTLLLNQPRGMALQLERKWETGSSRGDLPYQPTPVPRSAPAAPAVSPPGGALLGHPGMLFFRSLGLLHACIRMLFTPYGATLSPQMYRMVDLEQLSSATFASRQEGFS